LKSNVCTACTEISGCKSCSSDGVCSACQEGFYSKNGACYACTKLSNCGQCSADGKCTTCLAGYYPNALGVCTVCQDTNCAKCSAAGTGQCSACSTGYRLNAGKCVACGDTNCATCSAAGTGKCDTCKPNYLKVDSTCKACQDTNCASCDAAGTAQCNACEANYYLTTKTCTACADRKYAAIGASECTSCEDSHCSKCTAKNTCATCDKGFGLKVDKSCGSCKDKNGDNCLDCTGYLIGQCTECAEGSTLVEGRCVTGPQKETGDVAVDVSVRWIMGEEEFLSYGGLAYAGPASAIGMGLDPALVKATGYKLGSIIVLFKVYTEKGSTVTAEQLAATVKAADFNIFEGIENEAPTAVESTNPSTSCGLGQYLDSNGDCQACSEDCPNCRSATDCNKKSNKLGAILGGVLGGLAFILLAVILVVKKDAIFGLGSPKSGRSAKYNLANSSPTSPSVQTYQT